MYRFAGFAVVFAFSLATTGYALGFDEETVCDPSQIKRYFGTVGIGTIASSGSVVFVARSSGQILVISAEDLHNPSVERFFHVDGPAKSCITKNGCLFIGTDQHVYAFNISDPLNPNFLDRFPVAGQSIAFQDGMLLASGDDGTIAFLRFDFAGQFDLIAETTTSFDINRVGFSGDSFYIATDGGFAILDLSQPSEISVSPEPDLFGFEQQLLVVGNRRYALTSAGLYVTAPDPLNGEDETATVISPGFANGMIVDGPFILFNDSFSDSLVRALYRSPGELYIVDSIPESRSRYAVGLTRVDNGYCYAVDDAGIRFAHVHPDNGLELTATLDITLNSINDFVPLEDAIVVLDQNSRALRYTTDPLGNQTPVEISPDADGFTNIDGNNSRLLGLRSGSGVWVAEAEGDGSTTAIITPDNPGRVLMTDQFGTLAAFSDSRDRLFVYDLTDAYQPELLLALQRDRSPNDFAITSDSLALNWAGNLVQFYDISKDSEPIPTNELTFDSTNLAIASSDGRVSISAGQTVYTYAVSAGVPTLLGISKGLALSTESVIAGDYCFVETTQRVRVGDRRKPICGNITSWSIPRSRGPARLTDHQVFVGTLDGEVYGIDFTACILDRVCRANFANPCDRLDNSDIFEFLNLFQAASPSADFDENGVINFFDVSSYLVAFLDGCNSDG
jgi:hypothetical protein